MNRHREIAAQLHQPLRRCGKSASYIDEPRILRLVADQLEFDVETVFRRRKEHDPAMSRAAARRARPNLAARNACPACDPSLWNPQRHCARAGNRRDVVAMPVSDQWSRVESSAGASPGSAATAVLYSASSDQGRTGDFSKRAASVNRPGNGSGLRATTCASPVSTSCA